MELSVVYVSGVGVEVVSLEQLLISGHCDFPEPSMDATHAGTTPSRLDRYVGFCDRYDCILDGSEVFSTATIVQRVLESRKILQKRQKEKKEPTLQEAESAALLDG